MKNVLDAYEATVRNPERGKEGFCNEIYPIGTVLTVRVIGIYEHFVEVGFPENDRYIGSIHISQVKDSYVKKLEDYFYVNEIINVIVEGWDEAYGYELRYRDVRQPNNMKTNIIIQAIITNSLDGDRRYACSFVDYKGTGVVIAPKNYTVRIGSLLPVRVIDLQKDLVVAKL